MQTYSNKEKSKLRVLVPAEGLPGAGDPARGVSGQLCFIFTRGVSPTLSLYQNLTIPYAISIKDSFIEEGACLLLVLRSSQFWLPPQVYMAS